MAAAGQRVRVGWPHLQHLVEHSQRGGRLANASKSNACSFQKTVAKAGSLAQLHPDLQADLDLGNRSAGPDEQQQQERHQRQMAVDHDLRRDPARHLRPTVRRPTAAPGRTISCRAWRLPASPAPIGRASASSAISAISLTVVATASMVDGRQWDEWGHCFRLSSEPLPIAYREVSRHPGVFPRASKKNALRISRSASFQTVSAASVGQLLPGVDHAVRIERNRLDALVRQPLREVRMVAGALAADADVLALACAGRDGAAAAGLDGRVALVEIGGQQLQARSRGPGPASAGSGRWSRSRSRRRTRGTRRPGSRCSAPRTS